MNTLQRHVLVETCKVFLVSQLITLSLMTICSAGKEGIQQGMPPYLMLKMIPYLVPEMLRFTIPGCLLYAVCTVFGRLSADNELLALKSAGVHLLRLVWPVLAFAWLLSLSTFWLYDVCASWSRPNMQRLAIDSVDEIAVYLLRSGKSFSNAGVSVVASAVKDRVLERPIVTLQQSSSGPVTLTALEAELDSNQGGRVLRIRGRDAELEFGNGRILSWPGRFVQEFNLETPSDDSQRSPAAVPLREMGRHYRQQQARVAELVAQRSQEQRDAAEPDPALEYHRERLFRFQAERQRRLANGFGCLCFAMIGIPVAIWRQSADTMSVFFLCFGPILLLHYPLLVYGETLARAGMLPTVMVWLGDIVLLVVGAGLMFRFTQR